jgi:glutamyl-tRNA synthetase
MYRDVRIGEKINATTVRTRFAPSPTGFLHVGGVRTALWAWLVARQASGVFLLRIEDTDDERNRHEWVEGICEGMRWLGLDWDDFSQSSDRVASHLAAAKRLIDEGKAYFCDCSREDIDRRAKLRGRAGHAGYDGHCSERQLGPGPSRVLRFRLQREGVTVVSDVVRGNPTFENALLDDPVIVRSTGKPLFVLANAVDDIEQQITHVIRGEEHLSTTPKYIQLWKALSSEPLPVFAHVPVIVNDKRQKLSKRRDQVALEMYRDQGYLPEVMLAYLGTIGWTPPDDRSRVTVKDMLSLFRLEDVNAAPGFFDIVNLRTRNAEAIRALPKAEFLSRSQPWFVAPKAPWSSSNFDPAALELLATFVQERASTLSEAPDLLLFLFCDQLSIDQAAWSKAARNPKLESVLRSALYSFQLCDWSVETIRLELERISLEQGMKVREVHLPVRIAVMGKSVGLPLFESVYALGRSRVLDRLRRAIEGIDNENVVANDSPMSGTPA